MGKLSGEATVIYIFVSLLQGLLSRERICSYWSKFFLLRVDPSLKGLCQLGKQTGSTVKILKIGTPEIITIIVLQLEQLDFTVQYCVQKMQTE